MKKIVIAAGCIAMSLGFIGCGGAQGDDPGTSYMPDMYYSRAYEAYGYNNLQADRDSLKSRGINYTAMPVTGTVAREEGMSYHLTNDSAGMNIASTLKNPMDTAAASAVNMKEAERIYLINCGICHGEKLDGNGPLWNNGSGAYPMQPRNLMDDYSKKLTDGHYFHVITFGIRAMGSYASQLHPDQRWWIIKYIRSKQGVAAPATAPVVADTAKTAAVTPTAKTADEKKSGTVKK